MRARSADWRVDRACPWLKLRQACPTTPGRHCTLNTFRGPKGFAAVNRGRYFAPHFSRGRTDIGLPAQRRQSSEKCDLGQIEPRDCDEPSPKSRERRLPPATPLISTLALITEFCRTPRQARNVLDQPEAEGRCRNSKDHVAIRKLLRNACFPPATCNSYIAIKPRRDVSATGGRLHFLST